MNSLKNEPQKLKLQECSMCYVKYLFLPKNPKDFGFATHFDECAARWPFVQSAIEANPSLHTDPRYIGMESVRTAEADFYLLIELFCKLAPRTSLGASSFSIPVTYRYGDVTYKHHINFPAWKKNLYGKNAGHVVAERVSKEGESGRERAHKIMNDLLDLSEKQLKKDQVSVNKAIQEQLIRDKEIYDHQNHSDQGTLYKNVAWKYRDAPFEGIRPEDLATIGDIINKEW